MQSEVYLDAAYAIALSVPADEYHAQAITLAERVRVLGMRVVTSQAVLLEIGNALSKGRRRAAGVALIRGIEQDPNIEVVPLTPALWREAFELFAARTDKEWGLTDCISFVVMQERGIAAVLTTDQHFRQAGFEVLLGDEPTAL